MITSQIRGHTIIFAYGKWLYADTLEPTAGNERSCGYCNKENTIEGHDGCLGTLPGIKNACCGHGNVKEAYVQFMDSYSIHGKPAKKIMEKLNGNKSSKL